MARPLWLRLFGANGPSTIAELRDALLTAPVGEGIGDGRFLARLQAIIQPIAERPDPRLLDHNPDGGVREQAILTLAAVDNPALVPPPALDLAAAAAGATVTAPAPEEAAVNLAGLEERNASLYLSGIVPGQSLAGGPHSPLSHLDESVPYMLIGDMQNGAVIDTRNKTLMQGGPGDYPELGAAPNDTVELDGDYSAGFGFTVPTYVEQLIARAGNDYNLIADDASVAAGRTLMVNAAPLGAANHMIFDGSAETDGRFTFLGSEAGDIFLGGAGNDTLYGLGGADVLSGGGGSDTFAYYDAAQSSGADYDVLADFNAAADKIDLEVSVTGFDAAIQGGALSTGSFNADLGAALAGLGAGRAVFYAPDAGDLAGTIFLVVDANGIAGYQEGEDYVFALAGATLTDLSGHTGFFI